MLENIISNIATDVDEDSKKVLLKRSSELMKKGMFAGDAVTTVMEKAVVEYDSNKEYSLETISHQIPDEVRLDVQKNIKEALEWGGIAALYSYVL